MKQPAQHSRKCIIQSMLELVDLRFALTNDQHFFSSILLQHLIRIEMAPEKEGVKKDFSNHQNSKKLESLLDALAVERSLEIKKIDIELEKLSNQLQTSKTEH